MSIKKIQLRYFKVNNLLVIKNSGFIIPRATSIIVIIESKVNTPQIFALLDLNLSLPLNIAKL